MNNEFLSYYQRELAYFRGMTGKFSEDHPKIAARLGLGTGQLEDPHVERLIEGFAFLNARMRYRLDDDFPDFAQAILSIVYPHLLAPIPSMAIARFELGREQFDRTAAYEVPRQAEIVSGAVRGEKCRFRTCYPVRLWPVRLTQARFQSQPFQAPPHPELGRAQSLLRLDFEGFDREMSLEQLEQWGCLRFFINQPNYAFRLYELLLNDAIGITITGRETDTPPAAVTIPRERVRQVLRSVGFEQDEGALPYPPQSDIGYRLLTEYFAFPEKFLFFDLDLSAVPAAQWEQLGNGFRVYIYIATPFPDLERFVDAGTLQLGCTPIINLFQKRSERLKIRHRHAESRVILSASRPEAFEVYRIETVSGVNAAGEELEFRPFYSLQHSVATDHGQFYHAERVPSEDSDDPGTEIDLTLVDMGLDPTTTADFALEVTATCCNRDLPARLPFGGREPQLQLLGGGPVTLTCLTRPTRTRRPPQKTGLLWSLVSHLSLNHLSICGDQEGHQAFRELLTLYAQFLPSERSRSVIAGIVSVTNERSIARIQDEFGASICRGVDIELVLDRSKFDDDSLFLFASVLERFFGMYTTINTFTRLRTRIHEQEEWLREWQPRAGTKVLL